MRPLIRLLSALALVSCATTHTPDDPLSPLKFLIGNYSLPTSVHLLGCEGHFVDESIDGNNYHEACAFTVDPADFERLFKDSPVSRSAYSGEPGIVHGLKAGPAINFSDKYYSEYGRFEIYAGPDRSVAVAYGRSIVEITTKRR